MAAGKDLQWEERQLKSLNIRTVCNKSQISSNISSGKSINFASWPRLPRTFFVLGFFSGEAASFVGISLDLTLFVGLLGIFGLEKEKEEMVEMVVRVQVYTLLEVER